MAHTCVDLFLITTEHLKQDGLEPLKKNGGKGVTMTIFFLAHEGNVKMSHIALSIRYIYFMTILHKEYIVFK